MDFFKALKERHSIRSFQDKQVSKELIGKLLDAVNSAPSAGNLQAFEIVIVKSKGKKLELSDAGLGQGFIAKASVVFVFLANPEKSNSKYGKRGSELYCLQDSTIAAAYLQLAAVNLGLSSAWVGAFNDEEVKQVLGCDESFKPVAIIPVGFAAEKAFPTSRRNLKKEVKEV